MLSQQQIKSNIEALEKQGANPQEIQGWLDTIKISNTPVTKESVVPPTQQGSSIIKNVMGMFLAPYQVIAETSIGAAKGIISTLSGASELGEKALKKLVPEQIMTKLGFSPNQTSAEQLGISGKDEITQPSNQLQSIGKGVEQIAEFFIPFGAEMKVTKVPTILTKVINAVGQGAEFATKTAVQTGGNLKETGISGATGLVAPPLISGGIKLAEKTLPTVGKTMASVIGLMIGKEPEHIIRAFQNPIEVATAMAKKIIPDDVRNTAIIGLEKLKQETQSKFSTGLEDLSKTVTVGRQTTPFKNTLANGVKNIFRDLNIGVKKDGSLLFDKSTVVKGGEQKNLQEVYNTILNQKDFSVKGIQKTAARINALSQFVEGSQNLSSVAISRIHNAYSQLIEKTYPELGVLRKEYAVMQEQIKGIDEVLKSVKNEVANPNAVTGVVKKLSNLFKEDNEVYVRALQRLEDLTGIDLLNQLVATEFSRIAPTSFGSKAMQAGLFAGGIISNPFIFLMLPLFSPKLEGKIVTGAGKALPKIGELIKSQGKNIPRIITPLTNKQ